MTAPLAHLIMLAGEWMCGEPRWYICSVCGRTWDVLPDYADPERFTCQGNKS